MEVIIEEEKEYNNGKANITYWVRLKYTLWYEHLISFFSAGDYNYYPIANFDNLKEAKRCKELYLQDKWNGTVYSKVIKT